MPAPRNLLAAELKGWHVASRFDFVDHGAVQYEDRENTGVLKLGRGEPATGITYRGALPPKHYKLTWEARRTEGSDFFCGLTFPIQDSYATLIAGGWGGGVVGISNIDGLSAVENETTDYLQFKLGQWYRFALQITEETLRVTIDDKKVIDVDHEGHKYAVWWEQEQMAPLGFATWHTASEIRKIVLA